MLFGGKRRCRCSCAGLLPPLSRAAEILEDWVPLRCSAAGFGIGEEPQARCVQGRKTKRAKLSPVTDQNGGEGGQGDTRVQGTHTVRAGRLEQDTAQRSRRSVHGNKCVCVCNAIGDGPPKSGGQQQQASPINFRLVGHRPLRYWPWIPGFGGHVCPIADRSRILDHSSPHLGAFHTGTAFSML